MSFKMKLFVLAPLLIWIVLVDKVYKAYAGCRRQIPESQVARMCYESTASGAEVFVDTTGARATDNSSGPLCLCSATVNNAKFITLSVDGQNSACGSKLQFTFSKPGVFPVETNEANCLKTEHKEQIQQQEVVTVQLMKLKSPYVVDFCTKIKIETCGSSEYQCDGDAVCISDSQICDGFPDCSNEDEEDNCGSGSCTEGLVNCKDGHGCYSPTEVCNNVTTCLDGTDEAGCYADSNQVETTPKAINTEPIINIQCFESKRFSTTTTTTTTTTTPTTTSTTPTTTSTTPTTTSTTPTTTSTIPPTSSPIPIATSTIPTSIPTPATITMLTTTAPIIGENQTNESRPNTEALATERTTEDKPATTKSSYQVSISPNPKQISPNEGEEEVDVINMLKKPYVIAAIAAGVVLLAATSFIAFMVRRKMKRSMSKNLVPDLWIANDEKELQPLNT